VRLPAILILAVVQGLAELLPVSSSAHVIVAEKLMGLNASSPSMTLILVMLHTGTMFAVIVYFWRQWLEMYFRSMAAFKKFAGLVILATAFTGITGEILILLIERIAFRNSPGAEVEDLFNHLEIIAPALAAAGILICVGGLRERNAGSRSLPEAADPNMKQAAFIGVIQGLCLPFRGFSRSGATISAGMLSGVAKSQAEAFSFALAVVLTPPVVGREVLRLLRAERITGFGGLASAVFPGLLGAVFAFLAGLLALLWLSRWLERGRWYVFGIYCLGAAAVAALLYHAGY
jgi:undecaprenyl-diphosphatase